MSDFKLLGERIIVIPEKQFDTTQGGIYIPDQSKEERNVGIIAVIGEKCDKQFEHRRVIFEKHVGEKTYYEGIEALLMYSHDVVAFLN